MSADLVALAFQFGKANCFCSGLRVRKVFVANGNRRAGLAEAQDLSTALGKVPALLDLPARDFGFVAPELD